MLFSEWDARWQPPVVVQSAELTDSAEHIEKHTHDTCIDRQKTGPYKNCVATRQSSRSIELEKATSKRAFTLPLEPNTRPRRAWFGALGYKVISDAQKHHARVATTQRKTPPKPRSDPAKPKSRGETPSARPRSPDRRASKPTFPSDPLPSHGGDRRDALDFGFFIARLEIEASQRPFRGRGRARERRGGG